MVVAFAVHRRLNADLGQAFAVVDGHILGALVR